MYAHPRMNKRATYATVFQLRLELERAYHTRVAFVHRLSVECVRRVLRDESRCLFPRAQQEQLCILWVESGSLERRERHGASIADQHRHGVIASDAHNGSPVAASECTRGLVVVQCGAFAALDQHMWR